MFNAHRFNIYIWLSLVLTHTQLAMTMQLLDPSLSQEIRTFMGKETDLTQSQINDLSFYRGNVDSECFATLDNKIYIDESYFRDRTFAPDKKDLLYGFLKHEEGHLALNHSDGLYNKLKRSPFLFKSFTYGVLGLSCAFFWYGHTHKQQPLTYAAYALPALFPLISSQQRRREHAADEYATAKLCDEPTIGNAMHDFFMDKSKASSRWYHGFTNFLFGSHPTPTTRANTYSMASQLNSSLNKNAHEETTHLKDHIKSILKKENKLMPITISWTEKNYILGITQKKNNIYHIKLNKKFSKSKNLTTGMVSHEMGHIMNGHLESNPFLKDVLLKSCMTLGGFGILAAAAYNKSLLTTLTPIPYAFICLKSLWVKQEYDADSFVLKHSVPEINKEMVEFYSALQNVVNKTRWSFFNRPWLNRAWYFFQGYPSPPDRAARFEKHSKS